ncbi:MAG TPA: 3-deoxy-manno-octulosonate cytidylyltransferase [Catalimonadaceae bacterium]|nr:3-deoxy-manno-octulosonate cytidylyltransferase [Catalimonadaceae bacterium]
MKKAAVIIPARFASTRFPGKPLIKIGGITMIERVYIQATLCTEVSRILVATDSDEIFDTVRSFGGDAVMTSPLCQSGTDRCAEVISSREISEEIIINIQGDEPFIKPEQISQLIRLMQPEHIHIGTLARRITDQETVFNPNVVKVVKASTGKALYFSRNPIPFVRGADAESWLGSATFFKHIGLYGYKKDVLTKLAKLPIGQLEKAESLEQLRWLEAGYELYAAETEWESLGIDTPADLEKATQFLQS